MNSRTHSTTVAAWHADVFAYLSQSANIPEWAPGFAREVRVDGQFWDDTVQETVRLYVAKPRPRMVRLVRESSLSSVA